MTANIIQALANHEIKRYNLALEKLKHRELDEQQRHNQVSERESIRHNRFQELESQRSNMANENIKRESNSIDRLNASTNALNAQTNIRNVRVSEKNAAINAYNADTSRRSANVSMFSAITNASTNVANATVRQRELEEQIRHNKAVEAETNRNNIVVNDIRSREADISQRRAETERWAAERRYEVDQQYIQQGWARNIGDIVINGARMTAAPQ